MTRRNIDQPHKKTARDSSTRRRLFTSLAAAGVAGTGSLAQADIITTLMGVPGSSDNASIPANHGSTAETTLTWAADNPAALDPWDQYANWNGRGEVYQINARTADIKFAPASASIKVTINSFELDEWAGGGNTTAAWSVTGSSSGVIASGTWDLRNTANDPANAGGRDLISPNASGVPGETLTVLFDHSASGGFISYLAMDNLTFSSMIIPEPATAVMAWLGVGGLGALAIRRKRE